mmetsp:Transcript_84705/g.141687  ORF Transcript_84705/g.141687 Transcript_84705/m.141687 type:complete len:217 (+) Transcript_84705:2080-2730(+)
MVVNVSMSDNGGPHAPELVPRGPGTPVRSADTVERDVEQCSGGGASDSDRVVRDVEYCGAAAAASERLDLYVSGTLPESDRDAEGLGRPAVERYVSGTLLEASVPVSTEGLENCVVVYEETVRGDDGGERSLPECSLDAAAGTDAPPGGGRRTCEGGSRACGSSIPRAAGPGGGRRRAARRARLCSARNWGVCEYRSHSAMRTGGARSVSDWESLS